MTRRSTKRFSKNGNLAQSQVDRLSTSFQVFDKVLLALRQDYLRHGKTESVNDWVSALQVNRDYVGIVSVIGADGEVDSTTSPGMNLNFADREYFKTHQAQAADVLLIGRAVKGRQHRQMGHFPDPAFEQARWLLWWRHFHGA